MTSTPGAPGEGATLTITLTLTPDEYDALDQLISDGRDAIFRYIELWDGRREEEIVFLRRAQAFGAELGQRLFDAFHAQLPEVVRQREIEGKARADAWMAEMNAKIAAAKEPA